MRWKAGAIFLIAFGVYCLCPVSTSFDSRWTVPVALNLLEHGRTDLDPYPRLLRENDFYAVEQISGHYYSWYPVAIPVLAAVPVWALKEGTQVVSPVLAGIGFHSSSPTVRAFFAGDFIAARGLVEVIVASFFVALTAAVVFLTAALCLPARRAGLVALVFAFATPAWSTATRALWQHGPSMLMLAATIYLLMLAARRPSLVPYIAIPVTLACFIRPTNALPAAVVTLYVLRQHRSYLVRYLLCALPVAAAFLAYNFSTYHRPFPSYYGLRPPLPDSRVLAALAANLVSPSRGLLIFSPVLAFSIWGTWAHGAKWQAPLSRYLMFLLLGHWLLISLFVNFWWAGHSYGPRLFTDVMPVFVWFLIPVFAGWSWRRPAAVVFVVLAGASVFIHSRGARDFNVYLWNSQPVNVDQQPNRVWDWSDPQFLRGL